MEVSQDRKTVVIPRLPSIDDLELKFDRHECGCWLWKWPRPKTGRGRMKLGGTEYAANIVVYVAHVGPVSEEMALYRTCPNRSCVNPDHHQQLPKAEQRLRERSDDRGEPIALGPKVRPPKRFHDQHLIPEYRSWQAAIKRCEYKKYEQYDRYGGRGIRICDRWRNSFEAFYDDMGPRPTSRHTLDRIDNDGNYEPGNCRWATPKEQAENRRTSRLITFDGSTDTLSGWGRRLGRNHVVAKRLRRGWSMERALTTPLRKYGRRAKSSIVDTASKSPIADSAKGSP